MGFVLGLAGLQLTFLTADNIELNFSLVGGRALVSDKFFVYLNWWKGNSTLYDFMLSWWGRRRVSLLSGECLSSWATTVSIEALLPKKWLKITCWVQNKFSSFFFFFFPPFIKLLISTHDIYIFFIVFSLNVLLRKRNEKATWWCLAAHRLLNHHSGSPLFSSTINFYSLWKRLVNAHITLLAKVLCITYVEMWNVQ